MVKDKEATFVQPAIPRFDGHYDHWSMLMENFLRSKEFWTVVDSGVPEPVAAEMTDTQKAELEAMKLKDLKAKNYLFQAIDRSILETILSKESSKKIWDSMKQKFQGSRKARRQLLQTLRTEFEMLRMKSSESISDFFSRTMAIVNKMCVHGEKMEDVTVLEKILRSMTPKFNYVVCSIEESKDLDTLSIDELQGSLLVHEEELSLLMVCHAKEESRENMWYLDTGCSNHMCGSKSAFFELDETFRDKVKFGDNSKISVMGKGKVTIQTKNSFQIISDVLYVPDLKTNLLSLGQLQEKGFSISIKDGVCNIFDKKAELVVQVKMTTNRMFPLYFHNTTNAATACFSARMNDETWLWHFRYGHLSFGGLKTLQQKNMVSGLPPIEVSSQICEECVVSKQPRNQFPVGKSYRAKKLLELVRSDTTDRYNKYHKMEERISGSVKNFIDH